MVDSHSRSGTSEMWLARHPGVARIAFAGSSETGRKIIEASAVNIKKLQLEFDGKSPDIIFADADLDKAIQGAAMGVFANSGHERDPFPPLYANIRMSVG